MRRAERNPRAFDARAAAGRGALPRARRALFPPVAASLAVLAVSCSRVEEGPRKQAPSWAYEREFRANPAVPVSFVLRLDRVEGKLSDRFALEEELRVGPGFEAEFPEYLPEDFEGFSVTEIREASPEPPEAAPPAAEARATVRRKRLALEPDRSGELTIAPLAVYYHRTGEAEESFFLTDEVKVAVEPAADIGSLAPGPPRGIYEAPPPERRGGIPLWALAAGGLALLALAAAAYRLLRARGVPPLPPPEEIAWEALRKLVALRLLERGEVERFFVVLSAILREYVENRFCVHAPERTTEEFLDEAARHPALAGHRARLGEFLSLSDRVKFARYRPDDAAIQGAFDAAKRFIAETTPAEGVRDHAP